MAGHPTGVVRCRGRRGRSARRDRARRTPGLQPGLESPFRRPEPRFEYCYVRGGWRFASKAGVPSG